MSTKPYGQFRASLSDQPDPSLSIVDFVIPVSGNPNTLGLQTEQLNSMALDTTTGNLYYTTDGKTWLLIAGSGGTSYKSANQQLNVGGVSQWTFNHGLGAVPSDVRAVTVDLSGDLGYAALSEIDVAAWFAPNQSSPLFVVDTTATQVIVSAVLAPNGNENQITVGGSHPTNAAFWALKVYARL